MPGWTDAGDQPYPIWITHTSQDEVVGDSMRKGKQANTLVAYSGDGISMYTPCGTHIDTFNHFGCNAPSCLAQVRRREATAPSPGEKWRCYHRR
jgi:hypothetical protein